MANLKNIKKGDKVILRLFTGAFVGAKVVEKADAKQIGFTNVKGVKMIFDKATGKQISPEPKKPQFASYLDLYDEKVEKEEAAKKVRKPKEDKKKAKVTAPAKKTSSKPKTKKVVIEDDDEFEEVE